jgi:GNAT superfamily N-acetyltransferase
MMLSTWVQFTWKLADLPEERPGLDKRYVMDLARIPEDAGLLDAAISRSCSMEAAWAHDLNPRLKVMRELIEHHATTGQVMFLAIKHGARVIGASFIRPGTEFPTNLPVGICVLNEYRCRGLGTALLYESLYRLKQKGNETAKVVTKKGLTADRFLYRKFGGERLVLAVPPG